jgi:hypothetical protein
MYLTFTFFVLDRIGIELQAETHLFIFTINLGNYSVLTAIIVKGIYSETRL